jgi:hypothetical protein
LGVNYLQFRGPVIYAHATRAKLRIGHIWDQLRDTGNLEASLDELGLASDNAGVEAWLNRVVCEIHASNGERFRPASASGLDLMSMAGRMAYLGVLHAGNQEAQDRLMRGIGLAAGRTLGALHGSGGHGMGRRLKLRDVKGRFVRDRWGMVMRAGAPGGGPTTSRNTTVAGEWMDLSNLSNPAMDWTSRFLRVWSRLDKTRGQPHHPRNVRMYQRSDLELARESMTTMSAILTGDEDLVDPVLAEIEKARRSRKRIEDRVRLSSLSREERLDLVEKIEGLERDIRGLRDRIRPVSDNPCLAAFQASYDAMFEAAARAYPRYADTSPRHPGDGAARLPGVGEQP